MKFRFPNFYDMKFPNPTSGSFDIHFGYIDLDVLSFQNLLENLRKLTVNS